MSIKETQANIKSRVWKAIAQAELDLTALPQETLDQLVNVVSEAAMLELDVSLQETDDAVMKSAEAAAPPVPAAEQAEKTEGAERILWQGRPFLNISKHYTITNERVRFEDGLMSKRRIDIELLKIQDINQSQKVSERMINVGDLTIRSHDPSNPLIVLENVANVQEVHEILRRAMLEARQEVNYGYREEM